MDEKPHTCKSYNIDTLGIFVKQYFNPSSKYFTYTWNKICENVHYFICFDSYVNIIIVTVSLSHMHYTTC